MTVDTGGRVRGFVGRWLMRFEAAGAILRMAFLGLTAASTGTSALINAGYRELALPALAIGALGSFCFAFAYVELGVFNRKNREKMDRGDNFSGPGMYMGSSLNAIAFGAALEATENGDDPREAAQEAVASQWREYRDGLDMTELEETDG